MAHHHNNNQLAPLDHLPEQSPKAKTRRRLLGPLVSVGQYRLGRTLGEGAHGVVYRATPKQKRRGEVAVKIVRREENDDEYCARMEAELHVACHTHPNVPKCYDFLLSTTKSFLVLELFPEGSMADFVQRYGPLSPTTAAHVGRQLASALAHMHARDIAHRDVKPRNVLVRTCPSVPKRNGDISDGDRDSDDDDGGAASLHVALCDFGSAVRWKNTDPPLRKPHGTPVCLAPEMLWKTAEGTCAYNPKACDVFSLGCVMFFFLSGHFPFEGDSTQAVAKSLLTGKQTYRLPKDLPEPCVDLVNKMLNRNPRQRITAAQILNHPFLAAERKQSA